jgi:hypothetical protein
MLLINYTPSSGYPRFALMARSLLQLIHLKAFKIFM